MGLWRRLVAVVDPAQGYFERQHPTPRRNQPLARGAVTYGPGVPGGSRAATEGEVAELRRRKASEHDAHAARLSEVERNWAPQVHRATQELITTGTARLEVADRVVQARILRFWRGDPVLHLTVEGHDGDKESITRLPRREVDGQAGLPLVSHYLIAAAAR